MNWYKQQLNIEQLDFIIDSFIFEDASPSIKIAQYISPRLLSNLVAWKDKGWSEEQIAKKFKITPSQVSKILKRYNASHKDPVFMDKEKEQLILNEIKMIRGLNKQPSILEISKNLKMS